jgi:RNA polymerase sigma-70 factor (ECF subfamily)
VDLSDEQLVLETLNGNSMAYTHLVQRYQGRIIAMAFRALRDNGLAEDLAQEVFLRAYRSLRHFQTDRRFGPWLITIASNRIRDYLRTRTRRNEVPWEFERVSMDSDNFALNKAVSRQDLDRIAKGIENMSKETAEVLHLRFIQGLDYEEIATSLEVPVGTIKSRISRARTTLRTLMEEV